MEIGEFSSVVVGIGISSLRPAEVEEIRSCLGFSSSSVFHLSQGPRPPLEEGSGPNSDFLGWHRQASRMAVRSSTGGTGPPRNQGLRDEAECDASSKWDVLLVGCCCPGNCYRGGWKWDSGVGPLRIQNGQTGFMFTWRGTGWWHRARENDFPCH